VSIVAGHYQHGLRRLVARQTDEPARGATPLELLFDLTFVAAFGVAGEQLAHGIVVGHWQTATVAFVLAMLAVVWAWINVSWFASAFDDDDWLFRLLTLVQMTGVIVLAIGLPALFVSIQEGDVLDLRLLVLGYVVMRVALILQWIRAVRSDPRYKPLALTYALFVGSAQVGWVLLATLPLHTFLALAVVAALFATEAAGPVVAEAMGGSRRAAGSTPWNPHHLAERLALLTIIALGETVFGTLSLATAITTSQAWTVDAGVAVGAGIALSFAMWWSYFLVPHASVLVARRTKVLSWAYAHVFLWGAIAAVGAGLYVSGEAREPGSDVQSTTVVASIAIPVIVFTLVRCLMQSSLVSALPHDHLVQIAAAALPGIAIVLSGAGLAISGCLLIVLASPVSVVLSFELGGWRSLDAQLERVTGPDQPSAASSGTRSAAPHGPAQTHTAHTSDAVHAVDAGHAPDAPTAPQAGHASDAPDQGEAEERERAGDDSDARDGRRAAGHRQASGRGRAAGDRDAAGGPDAARDGHTAPATHAARDACAARGSDAACDPGTG
jgi:low temperature requirement protein LtrA